MKSRELALIAILLAIGAVLALFVPSIGPITPDMVATFTCLAILLVKPKLGPALGIGAVAGVIAFLTTKSPFPWLNIPVHIVSSLLCALFVRAVGELRTGKVSWSPAIAPFVYNLPGAGIYITIMLIMGILPIQVYWVAWGQILLSTVFSVVVCWVLYQPARNSFAAASD